MFGLGVLFLEDVMYNDKTILLQVSRLQYASNTVGTILRIIIRIVKNIIRFDYIDTLCLYKTGIL